jgi:hypothetical protein
VQEQLRTFVDDIISGKTTTKEVSRLADQMDQFPGMQQRVRGIVDTFNEADIASAVEVRQEEVAQKKDAITANKLRDLAAEVSGVEVEKSDAVRSEEEIAAQNAILAQEVIDRNVAKTLQAEGIAEVQEEGAVANEPDIDDTALPATLNSVKGQGDVTLEPALVTTKFQVGLEAKSRNELIAEVKRKGLSRAGVVQKPALIKLLVDEKENRRKSIVERSQTIVIETEESLKAKSNRRLQEQAEGLGLSSEGSKGSLVTRILDDQSKLSDVKTKAELDASSRIQLEKQAKRFNVAPGSNRRILTKQIQKAQDLFVSQASTFVSEKPQQISDTTPGESFASDTLQDSDSVEINGEEFVVTETDDNNVELSSVDTDTVFLQPKNEPIEIDQGSLVKPTEGVIDAVTSEKTAQEEAVQETSQNIISQEQREQARQVLLDGPTELLKARLEVRVLSPLGSKKTLTKRLLDDLQDSEIQDLLQPGSTIGPQRRLENNTVKELKQLLKTAGLVRTGLKVDLVARLRESQAKEVPITTKSPAQAIAEQAVIKTDSVVKAPDTQTKKTATQLRQQAKKLNLNPKGTVAEVASRIAKAEQITEESVTVESPTRPNKKAVQAKKEEAFIDVTNTPEEKISSAFSEQDIQELTDLDNPTNLDALSDENPDSRDFVSLEEQINQEIQNMEEDGNFEVC